MRVLITGIGGNIAQWASRHLINRGHSVIGISTTIDNSSNWELSQPANPKGIHSIQPVIFGWDRLNKNFLELHKVDAIINFAGAPMMQRWTKKNRRKILSSRINSYSNICRVVNQLPKNQRPRCIINASSVAIYSTCTTRVDEHSTTSIDPGFFQSQVWHQVEQQTQQCKLSGVRTVTPRFGVVLGPDNRLRGMLHAARLYLGATLGSGKQKFSWIGHIDACRAIEHLLLTPLHGPINIVAPTSMTAAEFGCQLAQSVNRPAFLRIPAKALRLILGELAENFLCSAEVAPTRLCESGFVWKQPDARFALQAIAQELGFVSSPKKQSKSPPNRQPKVSERRTPWNWI